MFFQRRESHGDALRFGGKAPTDLDRNEELTCSSKRRRRRVDVVVYREEGSLDTRGSARGLPLW